MTDRHAATLKELVEAVAEGNGQLDAALRKEVLAGNIGTTALGLLANRVMHNAAGVSDEYLAELAKEGLSDDEIFECVCAAALGAGLVRVRAGLALLERK